MYPPVYFYIIKIDINPANMLLLKVNNRNTRKRCEVCPKLVKTPERRHSVVLVFLLLTLNTFHTFFLAFHLLTFNK